MIKKIAIILPAHNEHRFLKPLLKKIRQYSNLPIVVVDDGSNPKLLIPNNLKIYSLYHQLNLGKGAAMATGADFAFQKLKVNAVIFMDADGQHDPKYLPEFIKQLNLSYDLVFGSRSHVAGIPLIRYLGNKFASVYLNLLFGVYISDVLSGYRALTRQAYRLLKWDSSGYGVETEMVARLGKAKNALKFTEIPVSSIYIDKYKGVSLLDAVKILANSLWWKLS